ncbi:MAG: D-tyrosyl-tRNA(Tyr) deacylase [Clostridia bacterium]|nr:D-tyrosyl-tRNA(Tyr) deacylase [Clostridia bacterium]
MRAVVQRVLNASVEVENKIVGQINQGFLVLLGVGQEDDESDMKYIADKIMNLRVFEDENEKMNLSINDIKGELLVVSQFTLYGDCRKGRRPSFDTAGEPKMAKELYLKTCEYFKSFGIKTETGIFAADMKVNLLNDGPVTLLLDSKKLF